MDLQKKKKIITGAVAGITVVLVAVAIVIWKWPSGVPGTPNGTTSTPGNPSPIVGITNVVLNRSSYEIALARAMVWHSDAALFRMILSDDSGNAWIFTFVSPKNKGKGFEVVVDGQNTFSANDVTISGGDTALPAKIIYPDAAVPT